ncbi:hypothetical protein BSF41_25230 [Flavobacterium sp. ACN2]|jgi:hypothetical protein|uniref:hypothetical protein n=1 Tax=Flavobacterium sp. ACN2 TaxID=1975676 RepID=UPI000BB39230|nr:hypothetical protein [Flavobacterium sp. ACN2]PBI88395.1 hypothetical protein BSF41_25230 [Flavobacterium sp. ACN2]
MNIKLNPDEYIDFSIEKNKYLPFKVEDLLKLIIIVMFSFFVSQIFYDIKRFNKQFSITDLIPLVMMSSVLIILIVNFYKRFLVAYKWEYIVTNQRLIIKNHKNLIEHSFYFNCFPTLNFEENAYGNGYLVIGEKEPVFLGSSRLNLSENDIVLYNILKVKEVYSILKSKITNSPN